MASVPRSERAAARQAALKQGRALPPATPGGAPGFPIQDAAHWDKARQSVGRVKNPARRAQLAKLLQKTAPMVGRAQALGQSWAAPAGSSHANPDLGIYLADAQGDAPIPSGGLLTCPQCGKTGTASDFGASGASLDRQPPQLQTPAPGTGAVRDGIPAMRSGSDPHALANTRQALELARGALAPRRHPVTGPLDVIVARGADGTAVIRNRRGGGEVARIRRTGDGTRWVASVDGRDLEPRDHQRTALMEAVGTFNRAVAGAARPASAPLQPAPQQTPLMAQYGIPAIRALATPATSAGSGPRVTLAASAGDGDGTDENGLNPKGQAIYKKLIARGFPPARALAFAKNSQDAKPGQFRKAG